jgi:hypothetical protein
MFQELYQNSSPICSSDVSCDDCEYQIRMLDKNGKKTRFKICPLITIDFPKSKQRKFVGKDGSTYSLVKGVITKD